MMTTYSAARGALNPWSFGPHVDPETETRAGQRALAATVSGIACRLGHVLLRARGDDAPQIEAIAPEPGPLQQTDSAELRHLLRSALRSLSEQDRDLLQALYGEDRSMSSVARDRHVNRSTILRAHRGIIERLRRRIEPALAG